jgi:hypothetical protein
MEYMVSEAGSDVIAEINTSDGNIAVADSRTTAPAACKTAFAVIAILQYAF